MKTLKNHVIIYDDECPLCKAYTKAFVTTNMLDKNGRQAFTQASHFTPLLNKKRACDEIALVNTENKQVTYGIDSLLKILSHNIPILHIVFGFQPFRWIVKKLYAFVSYNRKVIMPGKIFESASACTPSFNIPYRLAYILFAWAITALVLNSYSKLLPPSILPPGDFTREFIICGGQILFQLVVVFFLRKDRVIHYLGNMMTISLGGAMLLIPVLLLSNLAPHLVTMMLPSAWFMIVVALMFLEHTRRIKIIGIHWLASVTWIIYRLIVLYIIL